MENNEYSSVAFEQEEREEHLSPDQFLGEDSLNSMLQIKSKITLSTASITSDDIIVPNLKKVGRSDTLIGLAGVVGEWGVVTPIHVLKLEDEGMYLLLEGLRRLFASMRNGVDTINAVVWDFSDKAEGKNKANLLSLMINRSQRFTPKEMWEQMQILEEVNGATPGLIEYLLQMHAGEAMKLKDVMLSDIEYSEIRSDLENNMLTIEEAYKKLCNARKKENRLAKEDALVLEGESASSMEEVSDEQRLGVEEVKNLLELTDVDIDSETLEGLDRSDEARGGEYVQDVDNRHPLDPKLKQSVLIRDEFTCQCCGLGGQQRLPVLAIHHIIEVSQGGPDSLDNLVTVCVSCHILIHTYAWGKIYVKFEDLSDDEKVTFKKIFKYGNIIIEADKRIGRTKEQAMADSRGAARHPFPGEGLSANKAAYEQAQRAAETSE